MSLSNCNSKASVLVIGVGLIKSHWKDLNNFRMAFDLVEVPVARFKKKDEPALHTSLYFILAAKQSF